MNTSVSSPGSGEFRLPVRVYIEDTDAGGIVYYVNYLKFMERARTEFLRGFGYEHYALAGDNYQFVVHSCEIRYHSPGRIDDQLEITAALSRAGRAGLDFVQRVLRGDELLCEARIRVACVQADTLRPCAIPAALRAAINKENT